MSPQSLLFSCHWALHFNSQCQHSWSDKGFIFDRGRGFKDQLLMSCCHLIKLSTLWDSGLQESLFGIDSSQPERNWLNNSEKLNSKLPSKLATASVDIRLVPSNQTLAAMLGLPCERTWWNVNCGLKRISPAANTKRNLFCKVTKTRNRSSP